MKVWIDVTDFLAWQANLTGIQRVQYHIAQEYIKAAPDTVSFFVYEQNHRAFREVAFDPKQVVAVGMMRQEPAKASATLTRLSKRAIRKVVPGRVITKLRTISQPTKRAAGSIFSSGDIVLVLGGVWAGDFIDDLVACKHESGFRLVHIVHDMIPALFPGYVVSWLPEAFTAYKRKVFVESDGLLTVSKATTQDALHFMKQYGITSPKIQQIRSGDESLSTSSPLPVRELGSEPFILSVGTIESRKNHQALFYAMKEAKLRGIELPKLVIVGRAGWHTEDLRYVIANDVDAKANMLILEDIDDRKLSWLYEHCLFTVFPSFYEGWGLPVAESLAYGKLCLSSSQSSMPEIAGDLIDYFSPYDTGALLERMVHYLDPAVLAKKEAKIKRSYKPTAWQATFVTVQAFVNGFGQK